MSVVNVIFLISFSAIHFPSPYILHGRENQCAGGKSSPPLCAVTFSASYGTCRHFKTFSQKWSWALHDKIWFRMWPRPFWLLAHTVGGWKNSAHRYEEPFAPCEVYTGFVGFAVCSVMISDGFYTTWIGFTETVASHWNLDYFSVSLVGCARSRWILILCSVSC